MLKQALRFVAGAIVTGVLWWSVIPAYTRAVAAVAGPLLRVDSRFRAAVLVERERDLFVTSSTPLPTATIPAAQLTYNVILLGGLFASNPRPWRGRNVRAFLLAAGIVFVTQALGVVITIESTYAGRQGDWSLQHYGDVGANAWLIAELVFRSVAMFGIVFASWWALTPDLDRR